MNKGYLNKLIKYMKQVYHIDDDLKGLTDTRVKPQYSTGETILAVLFGFLLRIQSFNELKYRLKSNDFKNIIAKKMKLPQIDTIRHTLKILDIQGLRKMHSSIIKKAKENKVLREGTIDGYTVAAIDGTTLFGSNKKSCEECCTMKTRSKHIHYFHNAAFMSLVGKEPRLIIDFELYKGTEDSSKKDEGELTVAKRLISKIVKEHKRTINVVVYDALACNSIWINHCLDQGTIPVVHVKDNNITSIKEVKTKTNKGSIKEEWHDSKRKCVVKTYEESFHMDEVDKPLRFIKFSKKTNEGRYSQVLLVTTGIDNFDTESQMCVEFDRDATSVDAFRENIRATTGFENLKLNSNSRDNVVDIFSQFGLRIGKDDEFSTVVDIYKTIINVDTMDGHTLTGQMFHSVNQHRRIVADKVIAYLIEK